MADNLLKKALHKHKLRQYGEARTLYQKILQKNPRDLDANYLLGTLWAESGDLVRAEQYLGRAAAMAPQSPMVQTNLGNVYKMQDKLEEAEQCFQAAIRLKPDLAQAHFGLGDVWELTGKETPARVLDCYKQAVTFEPGMAEAHLRIARILAADGNVLALDYFQKAEGFNPNLKGLTRDFGIACVRFGKHKEAGILLAAALKQEPDNDQLRYFLCIAEGREPDAALKLRYVEQEFDGFSRSFDRQLVEKLGYRGPEILRTLIDAGRGGKARFASVVDLGCGTGLAGAYLKAIAGHVTGVDLSRRMLDLAAKGQWYDELHQGEISALLGTLGRRFDLFTAGDLFIYVGPLEDMFAAVAASAAPGAVFALFTEHHDGPEDYVLRNTGRFAHMPEYVRRVAEKNGFAVEIEQRTDIRREYEDWISGDAFLLRQGGTLKKKTAKTAGATGKARGNREADKEPVAEKTAKTPRAKTPSNVKATEPLKKKKVSESPEKPAIPKPRRKKTDA